MAGIKNKGSRHLYLFPVPNMFLCLDFCPNLVGGLVQPSQKYQFSVYAPDGECLGAREVDVSSLSPKWLMNCRHLLEDGGEVFDRSWGDQLSFVSTRFTSERGAGLATFSVHGELAITVLLLGGHLNGADREVTQMFLTSVGNSAFVQASSQSEPFQSILRISARPVAIVILWANPRVERKDYDLLRELVPHFAASFFQINAERLRKQTRA